MEQAVGLIAAVGDNVSRADLKPGSPAATVIFGGFSEYREVLQLKPFSPSFAKAMQAL
jgi:hypothetical protein